MDDPVTASKTSAFVEGFKTVVRKQYLAICLIFGFILGFLLPQPGRALASWHTSTICVALIFFLSGLSLRTEDIQSIWRLRWRWFASVIVILFITPLFAFAALEIPLNPDELSIGLAIYSTAPTTLSACVIFTKEAGGHWPLALAISVATNFMATFTVPFLLKVVFEAVGDISLDPVDLLLKLSIMILLPLSLGKLSQRIRKISDFQQKYQKRISMFSGIVICFIPWMQVSESGDALTQVKLNQLTYIVLCATMAHFVFLGLGYAAAKVTKADYATTVTMIMTIGEKTLPVPLTVISFLPESMGEPGIIALPCILGHLVQTLVDSFLATQLGKKFDEKKAPLAGAVDTDIDDDTEMEHDIELIGTSAENK